MKITRNKLLAVALVVAGGCVFYSFTIRADKTSADAISTKAVRQDEDRLLAKTTRPAARLDDPELVKKPTMEFLQRLVDQGVSIEQAREIMANVNAGGTLEERERAAGALIVALMRHGMNEEAWSLIDPGPGSVRGIGLSTFFTWSSAPLGELLSKRIELTDPSERTNSLFCLTLGHPADVSDYLAKNNLFENKDDQRNFVTGLIEALRTGDNPQFSNSDSSQVSKVLGDVAGLVAKGKLDAGYFADLIKDGSPGGAFDQWKALDVIQSKRGVPDLVVCQKAVVNNMVREDADRAVESVLKNTVSRNSQPVWNALIGAMFETDSSQANLWLERNLSRLDQATSEKVITSVAHVAIKDKDLATGEMWANRIENSKVREALLADLRRPRKNK